MECFIFVGKLIPGIACGSFEDKLEKVLPPLERKKNLDLPNFKNAD